MSIRQYLNNRNRGHILALFATCLIIYLPFINNPLIFDDFGFLNYQSRFFCNSLFSNFGVRWFSYLSLCSTYQLFLDVPHLYRVTNLLIHFTNAVLVFYISHKFLSSHLNESSSEQFKLAFIASLIFLCHPVATYAVGYLIQRSILLATMFSLSMLLAYVHGIVSGHKRWLLVSVLFYFLAVFSKEHSIAAPAVIIAATFLLRSSIKTKKLDLVLTWFAYLAIGILATLYSRGVIGTIYEHDAPMLLNQLNHPQQSTHSLHLLSVISQAECFFKYWLLWLIPNPAWMSIDMRMAPKSEVFNFSNTFWVISFISYGLIAGKLLMQHGKRSLLGFALLYPWLYFLVEFSTIRIQEPFVLYRCYLWMPGAMLIIPLALAAGIEKRIRTGMLAIIVILLTSASYNRLWVMEDKFRLWNDAASILPSEDVSGANRIFYNRAQAAIENKNWLSAVADYQRVINNTKDLEQPYLGIASAYIGVKNYPQALEAYKKAIEINPNNPDTYWGKAYIEKNLNRNEDALSSIEKSCELGGKLACLMLPRIRESLK